MFAFPSSLPLLFSLSTPVDYLPLIDTSSDSFFSPIRKIR